MISAYTAILALGALLFWFAHERPALMPAWGPWDFSWVEYLGAVLALLWFCRGLYLSAADARPTAWRAALFFLGVVMIYAALQTRFDYLAQHMFFLNRIQQIAIHDLAPFLIALSGGGTVVMRGIPTLFQRLIAMRPAATLLGLLAQPLVAATLFVGIFYLWLVPAVHFRAMLDAQLYAVMNWSMVLDGLLFWSIILDPRPSPPAPVSLAARAAMAFGVMTPQTLLGAIITLAPRDLYPSYALCGRIFPSIDAMTDQHLGGIISWVPPLLISAIAMLLILGRMMRAEEAEASATSPRARQ